MPPKLTFIMPQALNSLPLWERDFGFIPHAPSLKHLFNPKCLHSIPAHTSEQVILNLAGIKQPAEIALAPWRYQVLFEKAPERACINADLVSLESGLNCVNLNPVLPKLTAAEQQAIHTLLNEFLVEDGIEWQCVGEQGFFLADNFPEINTTPLKQVKGQNIFPFMPTGDLSAKRYWHKLINELQMLLHTSRVNQTREIKNQTPVNGVWVWGNGKSLASIQTDIKQILGGDIDAQALALALKANWQVLPNSFNERHPLAQHTIIILDQLESAALADNMESWQQNWSELEEKWFIPALKAMQQEKISLQVSAANADLYKISAIPRWQFWRSRA